MEKGFASTFHKPFLIPLQATSTFGLTLRDDPERASCMLSVTRQETARKSLRKVAIPFTHPEAAILETALRTAAARILGW